MSDKILLKRTATAGKVPAPADLDPGELAVNTADGKLFTKKGDGQIVEFSAQETLRVVASEPLLAGQAVNLFTDVGGLRVRLAGAGLLRKADGFASADAASGDLVGVALIGGRVSGLDNLVPGQRYFLSLNAGGLSAVAPNAMGLLYQEIGVALDPQTLQTSASVAAKLV